MEEEAIKRARELFRTNTAKQAARRMNREGLKNKNGGKITASFVYQACALKTEYPTTETTATYGNAPVTTIGSEILLKFARDLIISPDLESSKKITILKNLF